MPPPATYRVVCLQTTPRFGDVEGNLGTVEAALAGVRADLVVIPELFSTGYSFRDREEARGFAEPWGGGPTLDRLAAWSERVGGAVVGGFLEVDGDRLFNAVALAAEGRLEARYRKLHLFGFEPDIFEPGDEPLPVVEHRGLRIGLMICFDWVFPEAARCLALEGADVLAHPSNLVLPYCRRAMPIRAIENGVYAVTANRVGVEHRAPRPELSFTGLSVIVSPLGEVLAEGGLEKPDRLEAVIDTSSSRDKTLRSGNDRIAERRPAFYGAITRQ